MLRYTCKELDILYFYMIIWTPVGCGTNSKTSKELDISLHRLPHKKIL